MEENDKEEEIKEADGKKNQKDKSAEDKTPALPLLDKPLHEPKQEEGIVIYVFS